MPEGGELTVSIGDISITDEDAAHRVEARPGDFAVLTVTDTGCGMDEATLKRIFEPFFTTKAAGKGTGLGLATVHGIVKQHGGWIEVSSEPGKGTTFRIHLPSAEQPPQAADDKVIRLPVAGGSETILIVEDDAALRKLVRSVLEEYGYCVFEAADAAEAMEAWSQEAERIQLLFTDIVLPHGMSGWKLARSLRAEKADLKVIYSTGFDGDMLQRQLDGELTDVLLRKPFPVQSLVRAIRECLDSRVAEPALGTSS
jgi:CheY-like chemotaxis protein